MSNKAVVFFDCDSTLVKIEGIDHLAGLRGKTAQVARLTDRSMKGVMPLAKAYAERMRLVRPDREALSKLASEYRSQVVPGARKAVAGLLSAGHAVFVLSGGFRQAVEPFATWLGVPESNVRALRITLNAAGKYAGYDRASPLLRPDGKAQICKQVLGDYPGRRGFMVGDAATDARTGAARISFIHYAGVLDRGSAQIETAKMCTIRDMAVLVKLIGKTLAADSRQ